MRKPAILIAATLLSVAPAHAESVMTDFMEVMIPHMDEFVPEPTLAARGYALTFTAAYDAWAAYDPDAVGVVTGDLLDGTGGPVSDGAREEAILHAMITVQYGVTGKRNALIRRMELMGFRYDSQTDAAILGRRIGAAVLASRRQDGSNQPGQYDDTSHYMIEPAENFRAWQPDIIDRMTQEPLTPHWGRVLPFAMMDVSVHRAPPPPALGSPEFDAQVQEIIDVSAHLTDEQKAIAEYWAPVRWGSPASHLTDLSRDVSMRDGYSLEQDVEMFFVIGNAFLDAGIAAWDSKYHYNYVRPVTVIQRMGDTQITAYNHRRNDTDTIRARDWEPYLETPPFPEYVSGHSAFTAAWARAMELYTGSPDFNYTARVYELNEEGRSHLFNPINLYYATYWDAAVASGMSRIYGGIHWMAGNREGLNMGRVIGEEAYERSLAYFEGAAMTPTAVLASTESQYWRPMPDGPGRMSEVIDPMPVGQYALSAQLSARNADGSRNPVRITVRAGDGTDRILGVYDESRHGTQSPWATIGWRSTGEEPFYLTIEPVGDAEDFEIVQIYQVRVN